MSKNSSLKNGALYKQIVDWVINCIEERKLQPGDKLPTEKALAEQFSVSRGTVRTAMNMLKENRVITVVQGSGYYISNLQNAFREDRSVSVVDQVNALVATLRAQNYSNESITMFFTSAMELYDQHKQDINLTVVECNPDILPVFRRQLSNIPFVKISTFIIHDGTTVSDLDALEDADFITTTPNHFSHLLALRPKLIDKVVKYNVSITPRTLSALSRFRPETQVGLICESTRYFDLVHDALDNIYYDGHPLKVCYNDLDVPQFLSQIDCLILPYGSPLLEQHSMRETLAGFENKGGQIIEFDYQVEEGSIAYLKEMINNYRTSRIGKP